MIKNYITQSVLIIVFFAFLTINLWSVYNRPIFEPVWPSVTRGMAFSPYHLDQDGVTGIYPDLEQIEADLKFLSDKTNAIRIYTTEAVFYDIPELAEKYGIEVSVGAWISAQHEQNLQEIQRAISLSKRSNVDQIIIGNESLLRDEISVKELTTYLDLARNSSDKPVSTAETWHTWMQYPELAEHVDFIAVHILPYWEGIDIASAISFTADHMAQLSNRYPEKRIVIAETGWPSEGRTRNQAKASIANQATYLRRFLKLAEKEGYDYFLMEAFDQPWKQAIEGAVGAYWGIFDVMRQPKFPFDQSIVRVPNWKLLAGISVIAGIFLAGLLSVTSRTTYSTGRMVSSAIVFIMMSLITVLLNDYLAPYMSLTGRLTGVFLLMMFMVMVMLIFCETHEWIESFWGKARRRPAPDKQDHGKYSPRVSIHLPIYNEPPAMVIQTLNALTNLNYPDFEVIVIDNNTDDEAIWGPVSDHCEKLGGRFHFIHVNPLDGFKAGALNLALENTDENAHIIAVIDSDYNVNQDWLNKLVPAFINPKIAIIQAPQDYRDGNQNAFKSMCYAEYRAFFEIGMVTRNDRNAIIQHGTMTLVRKSVITELGGWAHWCITEDTELGLRIFESGYEAEYTTTSYGRGLTPDTFLDYKKQRYRWSYGAVQILKKHVKKLLPGHRSLSLGQRYHFIAGWFPWFAQSVNLIFSLFAICWSVGMMYAPDIFEVPHAAFSIFPIVFFGFNLVKMLHLYKYKLKATMIQTIGAAFASLSLSYTIGKAILYGLVTSDQPFYRTPKLVKPHLLSVAIKSSWEELLLFISFIIAVITLATMVHMGSPDYNLWLCLLGIQSIPYGAAFFMSLISALELPAGIFHPTDHRSANYKPETNEQ